MPENIFPQVKQEKAEVFQEDGALHPFRNFTGIASNETCPRSSAGVRESYFVRPRFNTSSLSFLGVYKMCS
jgi:hypothetical protein